MSLLWGARGQRWREEQQGCVGSIRGLGAPTGGGAAATHSAVRAGRPASVLNPLTPTFWVSQSGSEIHPTDGISLFDASNLVGQGSPGLGDAPLEAGSWLWIKAQRTPTHRSRRLDPPLLQPQGRRGYELEPSPGSQLLPHALHSAPSTPQGDGRPAGRRRTGALRLGHRTLTAVSLPLSS